MNILEVRHVGKSFRTDFWKRSVVALHDVSLDVKKGAVFGLIGPNGAGKTTLIKIILGLLKPSVGNIKVDVGNASEDFRHQVGYLPENAYYYDFLRPNEVLDFYGRLFDMSKAARNQKVSDLLEMVGLAHRSDRQLRNFSKGMLQRVGIAQALINDPELVILDEPMSGLDPLGRKEVRDIILTLKDQGKTIIFASHVLSDVEALCDDVAILVSGKLKAHGPIGSMVDPSIERIDITFKGEYSQAVKQKISYPSRKVGAHVIVSVHLNEEVNQVLEEGKEMGLELMGVHPHKESLEDIFVESL